MSKFAIATFCYGKRYYNQVNRLIEKVSNLDFKPQIVVVTDNVDSILKKDFVKVYDITKFNPEYKKYADNYFEFDFSVKRYSVLAALNLGYTKIILSDADAVPNDSLFTEEYLLKGFKENSIQGQITYNFSNEVGTNSMLGRRFMEYEKHFNVVYDKNELDFMPEDCVQFLDMNISKFYNFLRIWDECIKVKKENNLPNTPAGNIDEMCFAALHNDVSVGNNTDAYINGLLNIHDKWYYEGGTNNDGVIENEVSQEVSSVKKTIVTSIYELFYIKERGEGLYKGFGLLTQTINNIIFDNYDYVIYTDIKTNEKYNITGLFNRSNVTIKFKELNSEYYLNYLNPIKKRRVDEGEIWDRIYCVENYIEVIYNKFEIILEESKNNDGNIVWIDSGLFGTSCSNEWRDLMNNICHTQTYIDKIFEKIQEHKLISLKGNSIVINYEIKGKINHEFNTDLKVVPGCLFGGDCQIVYETLKDYRTVVENVVNILSDYLSEQEILYLILEKTNVKFFEFNDWDDLQRAMLKIMDLYNEELYDTHNCDYLKNNISNSEKFENEDSLDEIGIISHPLNDRERLEMVNRVSNKLLNSIDLTNNDYMLSKMSSFATLFHMKSGQEHYRLLSFIGQLYENDLMIDIGTNNGCSAIALGQNPKNKVISYDIVNYDEKNYIDMGNITFKIGNVLDDVETLKNSKLILVDANQDGIFEPKLYNKLIEINYSGLLIIDDIFLNNEMKLFWESITHEKYDITKKGHDVGTGIVIFE